MVGISTALIITSLRCLESQIVTLSYCVNDDGRDLCAFFTWCLQKLIKDDELGLCVAGGNRQGFISIDTLYI